MKEVGKDRNLDTMPQWVQLSIYLGIHLFVWGFFSYCFLKNFDKAFALTAVLGHQPARASRQEQTFFWASFLFSLKGSQSFL